MNIRVVVVDDHRIMREGFRAFIEGEEGMEVCGEAEDGRSAVAAALALKPDVILMDINLPGINGIEATRLVASRCPNTKVLVLSMHSDNRFIERALKAGAVGYLLKDCASGQLLRAIREVVGGKTYVFKRPSNRSVER